VEIYLHILRLIFGFLKQVLSVENVLVCTILL